MVYLYTLLGAGPPLFPPPPLAESERKRQSNHRPMPSPRNSRNGTSRAITQPLPIGIAAAMLSELPPFRLALLSAHCAPLLQVILHNKSLTQQKYNFVAFKREKRMQNAYDLLIFCLFLQDCLRIAAMSAHGAHHARFNVRARES